MPRLRKLKPALGTARPKLSRLPQDDAARSRFRDRSEPWRRWYKSARWQRLVALVLRAARYRCAFCGVVSDEKRGLVCDHVFDHKGDEDAFWIGPFQCLCATCHDGPKRRGDRVIGDALFACDGTPWPHEVKPGGQGGSDPWEGVVPRPASNHMRSFFSRGS